MWETTETAIKNVGVEALAGVEYRLKPLLQYLYCFSRPVGVEALAAGTKLNVVEYRLKPLLQFIH